MNLYYQMQALEQMNAELEMALMADRHQEMIDEAKYWNRFEADERDENDSWNIN